MAEIEKLPCYFSRIKINTSEDSVLVHQNPYLHQLGTMPHNASFNHFRSARVRLSWLANTRPYAERDITSVSR